ncbi:Oidioi.mRNA.OKI2018_I69.PAR.g13043.t1.cds [Oikopleura dioica]|uniref:tRNA-uridine aminocarboxypropyltransferase n=1 Tax=Oikopleura dioica TaxID=34765 RepID=A0ABN7S2U9_OIKDI|nr:Oidioi.mRNA.OKI2018_I69.PAR.g13043.t1.cds [Oikopleura dioica]
MPLLEAALHDCHVIRCRRVYNLDRPDLKELFKDKQPFLLFPSEDAISCENLPDNAALIAIDGTWRQARNMLFTSTGLSDLPKCRIDLSKKQFKNQYIIRTQPEEGFVSTLEAIAAALAESECNPSLYDTLTAPLRALCAIQLEHGAQQHHSKQELLAKGIWTGDRPKKNRNKLNRERLLIERYHQRSKLEEKEEEKSQTTTTTEAPFPNDSPPLVYCPCYHTETCTGRNGDIVPCDDSGKDAMSKCTDERSIISMGHDFVEKDGSIVEGLTALDLVNGRHCQVTVGYLTYWEGHQIQPGQGNEGNGRTKDSWRSRFSKYILPSLEFESHGSWSSDRCENNAELTAIPKNITDTLFPPKREYNSDPKYNRPRNYKYCLPTEIQYNKMKQEKIFDDQINREIASRKYPFYKRRNFWIITGCLGLFFLTIHLIIKQIRKIVAFVRTDLIMNIEQPELVEYSTRPENILGEGGCGRVYAGRFRGNNVAIKVIVEDIYSDSRKAERLKMECLILHTLNQHRNEFILQIYSPNVEVVATADRLEEIVLTKYGWDNNKRNLDDLLMEVRNRSMLKPDDPAYWNEEQVIQIVWHYCSVIADFGLSSICINDMGRDYLRKKQQSCFPIGNIKSVAKQVTQHIEWLKYFSKNNQWNNKALEFIQKEEQRQTSYFTRHIAPGTNRWRAPEIVYSSKDYYFKLSNEYHCKLGCLDKSDSEAGRLIVKDVCGKCTKEIFRFYRMNDIYGVGLVILSILKTVTEKEIFANLDYNTSEIKSFMENPEEVGTSREPSFITSEYSRDEFDKFLPEKILEHIQRQSIRSRLDYEPHLRCIRNIAEQCLRPNPYDRPEITEVCDELAAFEATRRPGNSTHWSPNTSSFKNDNHSPPTATTVLTK